MSYRQVVATIAAIAAIAIAAWVVIFLTADEALQDELLKEAGPALLQVALIGGVGLFGKDLLGRLATDRQRHAEALERARMAQEERLERERLAQAEAAERARMVQAEATERERTAREELRRSRLALLNSLTSTYWQIKKALHIIDAHRSARSYGVQMRQIIDDRLEIQRIHNEICSGMYRLEDQAAISAALDQLDTLLEEVIGEWKTEYLRLSQLQKRDEQTDDPDQKVVPAEIDDLLVLGRIRERRYKAIHDPFTTAVEPIRRELKHELAELGGMADGFAHAATEAPQHAAG